MTLLVAVDQLYAVAGVPYSLPEIISGAYPEFAIWKLQGQLPRKVILGLAYSGRPKTAEKLSQYGFVHVVPERKAVQAALLAANAPASNRMSAFQDIRTAINQTP